jgi:hypothetical protein
MEALLEKEGTVENWNDERMDELSRRMDAGFEKAATKVELVATNEKMNLRFDGVDRTMKERFEEVNRDSSEVKHELHRVNDRLDKLFYGVGFLGLALGLNLLADKV